jgi:predicted PurR-regulated permease PerM
VTRATKRFAHSASFRLTLMILAIIAFLYFAGELLKPLALSVLLSFALAPAVRFLERRKVPRAPAVILTVVVTLVGLCGISYVVGRQLSSLAAGLPDYQENIERKLERVFQPGRPSTAGRLSRLANEVTAKLETPAPVAGDEVAEPIQKVVVVSQPSFQERLRGVMGPYLEFLGVASFVLILVLFILMGREDLGDRIVHLFGHKQISLTTRTKAEIAQRITRYLATFAVVNSAFGLVIGIGLGCIGVPFAVLWGCLAGMMRFIPYIGPAVSFVLPLVFSFAHFEGWAQPLEIVALFAVVETALNSYLEPVIYGKTTGVSALGLLVAAMFWTWLWGTMGLLLSTPLTVCLAVLGKYVPSLQFFATFLGEEVELNPDVKFYERLVALDRDGAISMIEETTKHMPRAEIFDRILVPALRRAKRDAAGNELGEQEEAFVWRVTDDVLENLERSTQVSLAGSSDHANAEPGGTVPTPSPFHVMGIGVADTSDTLVLKMLGQLIGPAGFQFEIITDFESPLELAERVAEHSPRLVVLSHLPPGGLTQARYLVKRLRARLPDLPLMVGRWSGASAGSAAERLRAVGATQVVSTLAEARDRILAAAQQSRRDPAGIGPKASDRVLVGRQSAKIVS